MEKAGALISRLQQQYQQQADQSALLNTALLLVAELQNHATAEATPAGKVSVIMPLRPFEVVVTETESHPEQETGRPAEESTQTETIPVSPEPEEAATPDDQQEEAPDPDITSVTPTPAIEETDTEPAQTSAINTLAEEKFTEVIEEVPTLAQQQPKVVYELNDTLQTEPSINDRLRQQTPESGGKLNNEPIKDLRRAVGINDKYRFVRELFRNDEAAYERSVKTINSFNILPEAEYWIQREMKYKLGWDDNNPTVKDFYQLVRRRFS